MSSLKIFFGMVLVIMFGFLAAIMSPIFNEVIGNYNSTVQLIIIGIIPVMSIAILYGITGD